MPGRRLPENERREAILEAAYQVAVRDQLAGLSMRAVAEEAGVSKGLVFFHFTDKATLLLALLDWLLDQGPRVEIPPELESEHEGEPVRRLLDLVEHQIAGLPARRDWVGLFLEFWVMGQGTPAFRDRIRFSFNRMREGFVPWTEPVAARFPEEFGTGSATGLAAVLVSFIQGCALQLMSDPDRFDVDRYMRAVRGLVLH